MTITHEIQIGGGSWISLCPICGIHLNINFDDFENENYDDMYLGKSKNKVISNYNKFKKESVNWLLKNKTFNNYNKNTILLPGKEPKHNIKYEESNYFEDYEIYFYGKDKDTIKYGGVRGIPMHTECWNLAKEKFGYELKFEDFFYNKNEKKIPSSLSSKDMNNKYIMNNYLLKYLNYDVVEKYITQYWGDNIYNETNNFLLNKRDWYILYLPSGSSDESKKNSKRIEKNLKKIIKGIPKDKKEKKDRPSPSKSATLFKKGDKKKGNDGNLYIITINKNGVKKWKKIIKRSKSHKNKKKSRRRSRK